MESFFRPKSIAVAGVSKDPDKLGSIIFANMLENQRKGLLNATVYAINPTHVRIGDQPAYPDLASLPENIELLVIAVPESHTVGLVRAAAKAGVRATIIVTSGYAEVGRGEGEEEIGRIARKFGMRIIGPNTIGVVDTISGVDSLFLRPTKRLPDGSEVPSMRKPLKGGIVVITQSGHLGQVVVEELAANGIGIRALVGTGNQADVSVEDTLEYFAADEDARVIAVYLEGLRDGRRFMRAAASAVNRIPVVVFKAGKTEVGARAALTHTASMVGDYEVYRAAFRQAGAVEARSLQELIDCSVALSMLPASGGNRLAILTNAGGVGAMSADAAQGAGLRVESLPAGVQKRLRSQFNPNGFIRNAALGNPIDLTATAPTTDFVRMTELVLGLAQVDVGLVLPTHQTPAIGYDIGRLMTEAIRKTKKPVAASVIGNSELASRIHQEFMKEGIPSFPTPERAVSALAAGVAYARLKREAQAPSYNLTPRRRLRGGGPLTVAEVSRLLRSYGIDEPRSVVLRKSVDEGRLTRVRYPVACKLISKQLLHKTEAGGVVVDVKDRKEIESTFRRFERIARARKISFEGMLVQEMVRGGIELILGATRDKTFGPVVALGFGGTHAEVLHDYVLAVAPVKPDQVRRMLEDTRLGRVLGGYRRRARVNIDSLCRLVSNFSRILSENPSIEQIEVNPLMAAGSQLLAVDSRAISH